MDVSLSVVFHELFFVRGSSCLEVSNYPFETFIIIE